MFPSQSMEIVFMLPILLQKFYPYGAFEARPNVQLVCVDLRILKDTREAILADLEAPALPRHLHPRHLQTLHLQSTLQPATRHPRSSGLRRSKALSASSSMATPALTRHQ